MRFIMVQIAPVSPLSSPIWIPRDWPHASIAGEKTVVLALRPLILSPYETSFTSVRNRFAPATTISAPGLDPFRSGETIAAVYLNERGAPADIQVRSGEDASMVHLPARAIIEQALEGGYERFILMHNHPSGNPQPSCADIAATRQLFRTAAMMDLELIDHLIIARHDYFSFRAAGLL